MTWKNHRLTTFALAYAVAGGIFFSLFAMLASTLPDRLELWGLIKHRTVTHFWVLPVVVTLVLGVAARQSGIKPSSILLALVFGYAAHLFEDALSKSGIPVFGPWGSRAGVGLYVTGQASEWITAWVLILLSIGLAAGKGYFSMAHLLGRQVEFLSFGRDILSLLDTLRTLISRS